MWIQVREASVESLLFKSSKNVVELPILFSRMHQLRLLNFNTKKWVGILDSKWVKIFEVERYSLKILLFNLEEYKFIVLHMWLTNLKQFWHGEKVTISYYIYIYINVLWDPTSFREENETLYIQCRLWNVIYCLLNIFLHVN